MSQSWVSVGLGRLGHTYRYILEPTTVVDAPWKRE